MILRTHQDIVPPLGLLFEKITTKEEEKEKRITTLGPGEATQGASRAGNRHHHRRLHHNAVGRHLA
jgi:hypothetical protein